MGFVGSLVHTTVPEVDVVNGDELFCCWSFKPLLSSRTESAGVVEAMDCLAPVPTLPPINRWYKSLVYLCNA